METYKTKSTSIAHGAGHFSVAHPLHTTLNHGDCLQINQSSAIRQQKTLIPLIPSFLVSAVLKDILAGVEVWKREEKRSLAGKTKERQVVRAEIHANNNCTLLHGIGGLEFAGFKENTTEAEVHHFGAPGLRHARGIITDHHMLRVSDPDSIVWLFGSRRVPFAEKRYFWSDWERIIVLPRVLLIPTAKGKL
jgi:hypothetical protein